MQRDNTQKMHIDASGADQGFSLIEVLVCIALIALVCVPLFSGMRLSATLNNKAHYTQLVTAYAQEELENVKSLSVEKYTAPYIAGGADADGVTYSYITSGTVWEELNDQATAIMNKMSSSVSLTPEQQKNLFAPFICEKKNIKIGGKNYMMRVKFMPAEYSRYDQSSAANVNVAGFYHVAEADAVRFPVIADEINLYDDTSIELLIGKLKEQGETKTDLDIMADMKKKVEVQIKSPDAEVAGENEKMSVRCDVTYAYPAEAPRAEVSYCVYKGSYDIYPAIGSEGAGTESGGNVFLFARAFRSLNNLCKNELIVTSNGDTNIFFVLGRESESDDFYNFNTVTVNGASYSSDYDVKVLVPGEMSVPGTNGMFYCNIKQNAEKLNVSEEYQTIGTENYQAIGYAIEIEMFDQEDENIRVAHMEASKIEK